MHPAWLLVASALQCPDGAPPPCRVSRAAPAAVAVLYFDLLSRDSADAYLADGLTEQLIVRLGQVPRLNVKSRFEVQRYRGRAVRDVAAVARALNASYLVTGSLRKAGARVVVTAELVRAGPGARRVWGEVFDRSSGDVLDIESTIATAVARAVAGQLDPAERTALARRPTQDPEAYQLYQRARALFNRGLYGNLERDLRAADAFYDAALERDSSFAEAWAGKAEAWVWLSDEVVPGMLGYTNGRRFALRALALDSNLAAAHAYLAYAVAALEHDWPTAEAHARRATALDPNGYSGWMNLGLVLGYQGRFDEAVGAMMNAWRADSLSTAVQANLDGVLFAARRFREELAWADREDAAGLHDAAAVMRVEALSFLAPDSAVRLSPGSVLYLARAGRLTEARDLLRQSRARIDSLLGGGAMVYVQPDWMAIWYAAVGDADEAFRWIGRAVDTRTGGSVLWLKTDPRFDNLRQDPRYPEMLRRLNLLP